MYSRLLNYIHARKIICLRSFYAIIDPVWYTPSDGEDPVSSSMAICLLERWSGKGPESVIGDALFGTNSRSSQHSYTLAVA
jgi:hypothetical protein